MKKTNVRSIIAGIGFLFNIVALALFSAPFVSFGSFSYSGFTCVGEAPNMWIGTVIALILTCILILISLLIALAPLLKDDIIIISRRSKKALLALVGTMGLVTVILQFCTIAFSKGVPYSVLLAVGGGAIASGLFAFLGTILSILSCTIDIPKETIDYSNKNEGQKNVSDSEKTIDINKLRELKNLLDEGVITQEEFDFIKRDMIGN